MSLRALRNHAGVTRPETFGVWRLTGPDAWERLDAVVPGDLYLGDAEARPALLLDDDGRVRTDLLVAAEGDDLWVLADGPLDGLGAERVDTPLVEVAGPEAGALLDAVFDRGTGSMAPFTLARFRHGVRALRVSRTGDAGWWLFGDATLHDRLVDAGAIPYERATALAAAVEGWCYDRHLPGFSALTPLELQLGSRLSRRKTDAPGARALEAARTGPRRRTVALRGDALTEGAALVWDGETVGEVLHAFDTPGGRIGAGLVPVSLAHPGLDFGGVCSVTPPFLLTKSAAKGGPDPYG